MSLLSPAAKRCVSKPYKPYVLIACAVVAGAACDLTARTGQTLVLGNRGSVFGSGGNAQSAPLPAVTVQSGATVLVQDADVFGGGIVVSQAGQQLFGEAGPGIVSDDNGTIRVQQGLVAGGPIVLQLPVDVFDDPAAGIDTVNSTVEITGGTVRGGGIVSQTGTTPDALPGIGVSVLNGTLRVTGGTIMAGPLIPPPAAEGVALSVFAVNTQSEILGGTFTDSVGVLDGRARIRGGSFNILVFQNTSAASCSEIRGGTFRIVAVQMGRVIVAGTGLTLVPLTPEISMLSGTLESGQAINTLVLQDSGGVFQLVSSGATGCP